MPANSLSTTRSSPALERIDLVRADISASLDTEQRGMLGQFLTPLPIARFMAGLFRRPIQPVRLLDAGAGLGALSSACVERWMSSPEPPGSIAVTAYEIDATLSAGLAAHLTSLQGEYPATQFQMRTVDFIEQAVNDLQFGSRDIYTHAILNPPYRKIASDSRHRHLLRSVGIETVNLYTAFVALAVALLAPGGQVVAIVPRSFCNGPYYRPFRQWLLSRAALTHIHLFDSRRSAFRDDKVLQENVIIHLERERPQSDVTVTISTDASFSDLRRDTHGFPDIVAPSDTNWFIHVPTAPSHRTRAHLPMATLSLSELGIEVATGPVVDFRLREHLRHKPGSGAVPLLYPGHFAGGRLNWPKDGKKPNAIVVNEATRKWLWPNGSYAVVRRFTAKEERRRVVACWLEANSLATEYIGFENHLNVFHSAKDGLDPDVAAGLATYLNSTAVDDYFRRFSGHTQVNATDLRQLRYPTRDVLTALGKWAREQNHLDQAAIDARIASDAQRQS